MQCKIKLLYLKHTTTSFLPVHGTDSLAGTRACAVISQNFWGTDAPEFVTLSFLFTVLYTVSENDQWLLCQ